MVLYLYHVSLSVVLTIHFMEILKVGFAFSLFLQMPSSVVLCSTATIYNTNMAFIFKSLEYIVHHKEVVKRNRLTLL